MLSNLVFDVYIFSLLKDRFMVEIIFNKMKLFFNYQIQLIVLISSVILIIMSSSLSYAHTNDSSPKNVISAPIIMGYYAQWSIYSPNLHIQDLPLALMTHLVYQSAHLTNDGLIELGDAFADVEHLYPNTLIEEETMLGSFGQLIKAKKQLPHLQTIISIGGWARSENFSTLTSTPAGREKIARSAVEFMLKYQFDGIEIDWQFPILPTNMTLLGKITHQHNDAKNLSLLLAEIRRQLPSKDYWLQLSLPPYSLVEDWQGAIIGDSIDLVVLDVSRIYGDLATPTDHLAPLFALEDKKSVNQLIKRLNQLQVANNKIILALPSFAIGWQGVKDINNGLQQSAKQLSWGSWDSKSSGETGVYTRKSLAYILASEDYPQYWDELSQSSYMFNPKRFDGHFIAFESARSVAAKVDYAKENNLAGIAVIKLHNGDDVLLNVYFSYHFLQGLYFKSITLWHHYKDIFIPVLQFFIMLIMVFIGILLFINQRNKIQLAEHKEFQALQQQLRNLEWPLLNLLTLSPQLLKNNLINTVSAEQLIMSSSQLLQPINTILTQTHFSYAPMHQKSEAVNVTDILLVTDSLMQINKQCRLIWQRDITCQLFTDRCQVQQFFYNLCIFCCDSLSKSDNLIINITDENNHIGFLIRTEQTRVKETLNHAQLKPLYAQAHLLNINLILATKNSAIFQFKIASAQYPLDNFHQGKLSFSTSTSAQSQHELVSSSLSLGHSDAIDKTDQRLTPDLENNGESLMSHHSLGGNALEKNVTEEMADSTKQQKGLFDNIALFNLSSMPSKDIVKGLEQACHFFANHLQHDASITIYQNEQQLTTFGEHDIKGKQKKVIAANEFSIEIVTLKPLKNDDEQLIKVLINQTQMIQHALKSLVKEPSTLAELYELTRHKEQINYLKAESGYTGIYLPSKKDPRYITMRLRTIKLYFDDSALLQIHRSYLVNPKKVSHVEYISRLKCHLVINNEKLPVSRTYLATLKSMHPEWFTQTNKR